MSCIAIDGSKGECCLNPWIGPKCSNGSDPNWSDAGCSSSNPCCPIGACPGDPTPPVKGCEKYCTGLSLLTTSPPVINSISISSSQLVINYKGSSGPSTPQGLNRWPGDYSSKVMWLYACSTSQGLACVYGGDMAKDKDQFVQKIIDSEVNFISLITNNKFVKSTDLGVILPDKTTYPVNFDPTASTSGQTQTPILFDKKQLKTLHDNGICIVLSVGSWLTDFYRDSSGSGWTDNEVKEYVDRFECIRCSLGNTIDGLDFDIEGMCDKQCLAESCDCSWGTECHGDGGMQMNNGKKTCYILPNQSTVTLMNQVSLELKKRGFVCTMVPPTNVMFSSSPKASNEYNGQNQFVKYGLNFSNFDGIMLQFYTGFDAGMCGDDWSKCRQDNITNLKEINLDYLVNKNKLKADYTNGLPLYPNYPNRNPLHCPRDIDCPDWAYKGEAPFKTQANYFKNLNKLKGVSMNKIVMGLEFFFNTSQWGPLPSVPLFYGLNEKLKTEGLQELGGVGGWTIAGTFGYYNYPNQLPTGTGLNNCSRTKGGTFNSQTKKYIENGSSDQDRKKQNMWSYSSYFTSFLSDLKTCWGSWGKDTKGNENGNKNVKATKLCGGLNIQLKGFQYAKTTESNYLLQCIPDNPPNTWPPPKEDIELGYSKYAFI